MNILLMLLSLSVTGAVMFFAVYALRPLLGKYFPQWTIYMLYIVVLLRLLIPYSPEFSVMQRVYSAISDRSTASQNTQPETAEAAYSETMMQSSISEDTDSGEDNATAPYDEHITTPDSTPDSHALSEKTLQPPAVSAAASGEKADGHKNYLSLLPIIMFSVWAVVTAALTLKLLAGYFVFLKRIKERQTIYAVPDEIAERLEKLPPVVQDSGSCSPMVIGLLRPKIILPEHEYDTEKLYCVLLHERTHYRRGDIIVKWLCELACCLYWFLPVMPLLRRELSDACETACDEKAVSDMDKVQRKIYVKTLLATAVDGAAAYDSMRLAPTMTASGRRFQERLKKNMTYKRSGALRGALSILLVCAFISAGILLGGCVKEGSITDIASSDKPEGRVELDPMQYPDWEIAIWDHYNRTSVPHRKNAKPITLCGRQYMSDDTVVSLDLSNFDGPADLSPLKEFEHIDYLLMNGTYGEADTPQAELTDLSPITELKGLKGFVFDGFDISDLSFIPSIEGLELLSVRRPAAEHIDYSFVRSISSLRELYINIYDGSPLDFLEGCTTLERLELGGEMGNVVSGGFPHGMTGLRRLHLDIVSLDDYSGLRDCAGMESLYISSVSFFGEGLGPDFADVHMDLSFLRSMPGLKELSIQAGSPKGIENICSVGSLETLSLSLVYPFSMDTSEEEAIHIAEDCDLSQISKLTSLKNVSFTVLEFPWYLNNHGTADKIAHIIAEKILTSLPDGIHSFTGLVIDEENARLLCRFKALEKLETNLICGPNALDFLTETPNMKELRLNLSSNGTEGVDLAPLGRLTGLERLELEKYNSAPFENLDALSGLTQLKKLLLWDEDPTAFDNGRLAFLEGMDKLSDLELHNVHENCDLSPISSLSSLKYLRIGISFLIPEDQRQTAIEQGRLEEVYASGGRRHIDLSFLAPLDGLENVSIAIDSDFEVDALDLSPLSGKGKLRRLRVEMPCGGAPDLSALSGCGALENITIVFLNENGGAVREEAKRFIEANPGFAVSENGSELYIDRVSSFEPDTQETSRSADSGDISAVPTLESIYDRGESASPTDILNGMTLALLTTAWGEPDGGYERTMTQTFRVAWWYIKGTDRMLSVKCIGIGNEVFDARIDPLTDPSCPLIEPESVPDLSYPDSDGLLTLRQAIECVNYARTMLYRMSLDFPEEAREELSENPYCLTYVGYEAGESACFGTGVPCEEWRRDRYHSLVFHNEADTDSFRNGMPRPVWLIKLYDSSHHDGYYEEVIYVDAQTGDMYNGSKRGGYMPSPYKDRSEYARLYFQFVE